MPKFNGWENRETWNVSLWINNNEPLYRLACAYLREVGKKKATYKGFIKWAGLTGKTPDNVSWTSRKLSHKELDRMIKDLLD